MNLRRRHDDDELDPWGGSVWLDDDVDHVDHDDHDDDDDFDDDEGDVEARPARSRWWRAVAVVGIVAAVVGVATVTSRLMRQPPPATTAAAAAVVTTAAPAATTGVPTARVAPPATAPAPSTTVPAAAASSTVAARTEVSSLQTVPAVRDLVIEINGNRYATAADGSIAIAPADRHGMATVIGVRAVPALMQATFTSWADGVAVPSRSLDAVDGPVAQLGFTVHYRVLVEAGIATDGTVSFDSPVGPVAMPIGVPTFVAAARATLIGSSMSTAPIVYTARSIERGGTAAPITAASFSPSPEALWRVLP